MFQARQREALDLVRMRAPSARQDAAGVLSSKVVCVQPLKKWPFLTHIRQMAVEGSPPLPF
jgi:hypothetical protein